MPDDGDMTPLREAAGQLHEMYLELKRAGFTRSEAMELVARVLASGISEAVQNTQTNEDD